LKYNSIKRISGPLWKGISEYEEMREYFSKRLSGLERDTLIIFDKALRIHPFQTIPWYNKGFIKRPIFSHIQKQVSHNFHKLHSIKPNRKNTPHKVALHINRGSDYNREKYPLHFQDSYQVRHMFPISYFENIMDQVENAYGRGNVQFDIYTEKLNCEDIVSVFSKRPYTNLRINSNREEQNNDLIHSIFLEFVKADILVCSNSSFSAMAAYFRKDKKTIYHPHAHLDHLPEPEYIKTSADGAFDIALLLAEIKETSFKF
jgi:hypothetical protein